MFGTRGENPKINPPVIASLITTGENGDAGGFLVPRAFALDVEAMTEAWLDLDFLAQFFSTTLGRYADVTSLADVRRRELTKMIFSKPSQGGGKFYRN